ncbi:MAG: Holliday junction resolvase RuvX [Myxococcales bacterium]|nr:Holliday junction resolvase RuvX [Myxococcales bacterium]
MTHRTLGLDVGDKTVGVAVSDRLGIIAQGVTTLRRQSLKADLDALAALIAEHEVDRIVVGWPLQPNGRPGAQAARVERFADAVAAHTGLPIDRWDERMTTVLADRALREAGTRGARRREVVDKVAATLILQSWLDARPRSNTSGEPP